MKKRQAIVESATEPNGSLGCDAATGLEIADEADSFVLVFNKDISPLDEFPKHTSTGFQKIVNLINLHFKVFNDLLEHRLMVVTGLSSIA